MRSRLSAAGLLLLALAPELATESATLSTYYPAPAGIYNQLMTTKDAYLARDPGAKVGVGTVNPGAMLDVAGAIRFGDGRGELSDQGGAAALGSIGGLPLLLAPNGAEAVRMAPSGNIGIGAQNPATTLEINGLLSFTSPGGGYARICQDVAYDNASYVACPPNTTPVMRPGEMHECNEGTRGLKPCAFPEAGIMRCCKIAP